MGFGRLLAFRFCIIDRVVLIYRWKRQVRRAVIFAVAASFCIASWAGGNPAVGKWNCSSVGENGTKLEWSLSVREEGGQLAATATLDATEMPLFDVKLDGSTLTFQLRVNEHEVVDFELHIDGDKLTGRFEGPDSGKATITGTRTS